MRRIISRTAQQKNKLSFRKIESLRNSLRRSGSESAYNSLLKLAAGRTGAFSQKSAAWELALWHADNATKKDAIKCLEFLRLSNGFCDRNQTFRRVIIEVEARALLGETDKATELIDKHTQKEPLPDLFIAKANSTNEISKKITFINKALEMQKLSPLHTPKNKKLPLYDRLSSTTTKSVDYNQKVSVIIPAYNCEATIMATLESLRKQTYKNLEIMVVDDCSTDDTAKVIKEIAKKDTRIHLLKNEKNQGPYIARNIGLQQASGEFVTTNDADDWSHPEKIQRQAVHLQQNPSTFGNTSQQVRADNQLNFYRRGNRGFYIQTNISSFMFRREAVVEKIGFWDSVRFGADSEYIERLQKACGKDVVHHLGDSLLSFQRWEKGSLTSNTATGFYGYYSGDRLLYRKAYQAWHNKKNSNLKLDFPLSNRPFSAPQSMVIKNK